LAAPFGPNWPTVGTVISLFLQMGCERRQLPGSAVDDDGNEELVTYLYYPETRTLVAVVGFDSDDERMSPSEVEHYERRLGLTIPKNW
jgi:hypothetical protein